MAFKSPLRRRTSRRDLSRGIAAAYNFGTAGRSLGASMTPRLFVIAAGALLFAGTAEAAEIKVLSTQATEKAYKELVPQFEKTTGHKVVTVFTGTLDANKRLASGESYDMLIMSSGSIDEHTKGGKVAAGSRVDLAKSGVAIGVKAGA